MSLSSDAAIDRMNWVLDAVKRLLGENVQDLTTDPTRGQVTVEETTFCMAEDKLRILGICPKCVQDIPSMPINRLADVADERENFRPMRHRCMDV